MSNAIVRILREEEGTEMVEWGLIAGLIIVVAAGVFASIGTDVNTIFGGFTNLTCEAAIPRNQWVGNTCRDAKPDK